MKKAILVIIIVLIVVSGIFAWLILAPATTFASEKKYLYIREKNLPEEQVMRQIDTGNIIRSSGIFYMAANALHVWERIRPGRFEVAKGQSILDIVRTLRNNNQSPVKLTIKKLRIREDFARLIGKNFSTDSLSALRFLNNPDSLEIIDRDTNTLFTVIIPNTYFFNWNTSVRNILLRLKEEEEKFWAKENRLTKARNKNLTKTQVYTLASIVEEETNKNDEKENIASVYYNRLQKGMPLGADPTIKFALKDFGLKRIYFKHLNVSSPYNTYRNKGLPPGPISTPSISSIDAVLNAPPTGYLFFVAKSDFSGYHHFSTTYAEHTQYAKLYQQALNELILKKAQQGK